MVGSLPLIRRKLWLRSIMPQHGERLLYCGHIDRDGEGLFRLACEHDLEGIVAKRKDSTYRPQETTTWLKIRNTDYSQWAGREELFERERECDPDLLPPSSFITVLLYHTQARTIRVVHVSCGARAVSLYPMEF